MNVDIHYRPSYAMAVVTLDAGEAIQAESGVIVGMSSGLELKTEARGGFFQSLRRSVFGGESFFNYAFKKVQLSRAFLGLTRRFLPGHPNDK